ncbi:MAG: hypothetical protein MK008_11380 [Bdellovibrionales bacterium]|nr:hypothetical protein [Bdellovibrionales bacterium]
MRLLIFLFLFIIVGCQSSPKTIGLEDYDENSTAHGAAYVSDAIHIRKPMKSHSDWKPWEFYYKHCSLIEERYYMSKTSYECSRPYY